MIEHGDIVSEIKAFSDLEELSISDLNQCREKVIAQITTEGNVVTGNAILINCTRFTNQ